MNILVKILGLIHTAQAFKSAVSLCGICKKRFGHYPLILHGNGITDDTAALQYRMDCAEHLVFLKDGTYLIKRGPLVFGK